MKLVFIGISGSGKDTQANLLCEKFGFHQIPVGQLLRKRAAVGDDFGKKLEEGMLEGFVDDQMVLKVLHEYISKHHKIDDKLIFNGSVRSFEQIKMLDDLLASLGTKLDYAVYFNLDEKVAAERLLLRRQCVLNPKHIYHLKYYPPKVPGKCDIDGGNLVAREDDHPEAIHNRFAAFKKDSEKIYAEYKRRGQLIVINANQDIESVHKDLVKALGL